MSFVLPNLVFGVVSGSFDASQLTLDLNPGHGARFGSDFDLPGVLWNWTDHKSPLEARWDGTNDLEILLVTGRSGDTLDVLRGQEGFAGIVAKADKEYRLAVSATNGVWTSVFESVGGFVIITATTYTVVDGIKDVFVDDDTAGAPVTITLPASAANPGREIVIKKLGTTAKVTVDGNASETIDRALTKDIIFQDDALKIASDGSNWRIV